jgi:uncharacterized iron-regulated membrane protein
MTPRRFLFWIHLTAGSMAGLVILVMSLTGVLLAYKRQIVNWADRGFQSQPAPGAQRLPVEELLAKQEATQGRTPSGITLRSDPAAPVAFDFGREHTLFVNPYNGQLLGEESPQLRAFFSKVEDLHRWLGASTERRASGRAITGACNLSFLILVVTGPILWWPKEWNWRNLRKITLLRGGPWGRARDWNWHNSLGFWCAAPLFLIVITGVIMSYAWANNLLYRMAGNTPPPPIPIASQGRPERDSRQGKSHTLALPPDGLEKLFARAAQQVPEWTTISLRLPNPRQDTLTFSIDRGNGGRPEPFSSYNRGRRLRAWARFTHTGEAFGFPGQTIAAIATAGASLLVFTGLSLALRRFAGWKARGKALHETHEASVIRS